MHHRLKRVFNEWMAGTIGGLIPLFVFMMVHALIGLPGGEDQYQHGITEHFLVIATVTTGVCVFVQGARMKTGSAPIFHHDLRGPVFLAMLAIATSAYSAGLYALSLTLESDNQIPVRVSAMLALVASLLISLYLELAAMKVGVLSDCRGSSNVNAVTAGGHPASDGASEQSINQQWATHPVGQSPIPLKRPEAPCDSLQTWAGIGLRYELAGESEAAHNYRLAVNYAAAPIVGLRIAVTVT